MNPKTYDRFERLAWWLHDLENKIQRTTAPSARPLRRQMQENLNGALTALGILGYEAVHNGEIVEIRKTKE